MQRLLRNAAGERFVFERLDFKPAVETAEHDEFLKLCLGAVCAWKGQSVVANEVSCFSDACVLSPSFSLPMVIIGPGTVGGSGSVNESCGVHDLMHAARLLHRIAAAYLFP